jgi:hypothetical protein
MDRTFRPYRQRGVAAMRVRAGGLDYRRAGRRERIEQSVGGGRGTGATARPR